MAAPALMVPRLEPALRNGVELASPPAPELLTMWAMERATKNTITRIWNAMSA